MAEDNELDDLPEKDSQIPSDTTLDAPRLVIGLNRAGEGGDDGSYGERENTVNDTDLKATLKRLFPQFPNEAFDMVAQSIMVARITPEIFLDAMRLTVNSVVEEMDLQGISINFQSVINMVYAAFSIGLDGKGRIDILEVAGAAKETEELDKLSKQLGVT